MARETASHFSFLRTSLYRRYQKRPAAQTMNPVLPTIVGVLETTAEQGSETTYLHHSTGEQVGRAIKKR
jgi:hypothetical protein